MGAFCQAMPMQSPVQDHSSACVLQVLSTQAQPAFRWRQSLHRPQRLPTFQLFLMQYVYCPGHQTFEAVLGMPAHLPDSIARALHSLHGIDQGKPSWIKRYSVLLLSAASILHIMSSRSCQQDYDCSLDPPWTERDFGCWGALGWRYPICACLAC